MTQKEMKAHTKEYAKRIIRLCRALPDGAENRRIADQLFRAGTSVGSNYRAACRGRSKADFVSKLGIALEEADESLYWLEILTETRIVVPSLVASLIKEGDEIVAIFVSSINTSKSAK